MRWNAQRGATRSDTRLDSRQHENEVMLIFTTSEGAYIYQKRAPGFGFPIKVSGLGSGLKPGLGFTFIFQAWVIISS